ncbi:MAG: site-specific integrase [Alphaproteobacteria bacterium]|nr:site-specific integrase [Alphaproteobacteria bacterium]
MKPPRISITTWNRKRRSAAGKLVRQKRHCVGYICPETGHKRRLSFATKAKAEVFGQVLSAEFAGERYFNPNTNPTVAEVVTHWIDAKRGAVKSQTIRGYQPLMKIIVGPLLQGSPQQRVHHALTGEKPHRDTKLLLMLGTFKVSELTTAQLRRWHNLVREEVGAHTANRVMSMLKGILALAEEDFGVRVCSIPTNLAKRKSKPKKEILMLEEVGELIAFAKTDKDRGIYYTFPFLTGVRVSEQLGLLWDDIDFDQNVITICRVQERDGSLTEATKTEAGVRDIPMTPILRELLLAWRLICPRLDGALYRVFPGPGRLQPWPMPRKGGGHALLYQNFRRRFWLPVFAKLGLPYVTPHSARHSFISTLQAQGIEVGLVAKLAGHSNPTVTLGHYTQAVRGGADAMSTLDQAFSTETKETANVR